MKNLWLSLLLSIGIGPSKSVIVQRDKVDKFGEIEIMRQKTNPKLIVFLIYSEAYWKAKGEQLARSLAEDGNAAALISLEEYGKLKSGSKFCSGITDDLDELNKSLQQKMGLNEPIPLILLGKDRGANAVELAFSQTGNETFNGFLAIAPCKDAVLANLCEIAHPLPSFAKNAPFTCNLNNKLEENTLTEVMKAHRDLRLQSWIESVKDRLYTQAPVSNDGAVDDYLVETFPAQAKGDRLVIVFSGDGGWAKFIGSLADRFAADGTPVVGIDSLKYFWKRKSPLETAQDLSAIIAKYQERFHARHVQLIGFSFGADILPFAYQYLPKGIKDQVDRVSLISLSRFAEFEFHLDNWILSENSGLAVEPEISKLNRLKVDCAYGDQTGHESLCPELHHSFVHILKYPGGHFLNWETENIYRRISH